MHNFSVSRRQLVSMSGFPLLAACSSLPTLTEGSRRPGNLIVGGLFAGPRSDKGFMEADWRGFGGTGVR